MSRTYGLENIASDQIIADANSQLQKLVSVLETHFSGCEVTSVSVTVQRGEFRTHRKSATAVVRVEGSFTDVTVRV